MTIKENMTPGKIVGGITAVLGAIALVLWGVPWYLKGQVHELYEAEKVEDARLAPDENPVQNAATINAIQTQLNGIETRMIARDALFMEYLQRQQLAAEERANRGQ